MKQPGADREAAQAMLHEDLIGTMVTALLERADELADRLVERIAANAAHYGEGLFDADDLRRSCRDNIVAVLRVVTEPPVDAADAAEIGELARVARATGRRRAEQGVPLDAVLGAFRTGGRLLWTEMATAARQLGLPPGEALLDAGTAIWAAVDHGSSVVAEAYASARAEAGRRDAEHRRLVVERLLSGRSTRPGTTHEAARVLGLEADGHHAVVLTPRGRGDGAAGTLGPEWHSAWHALAVGDLGVVALAPARTGADEVRLRLAHLERALRRDRTLRAGVSGAVRLGELHAAYEDARAALATLPVDGPGVAVLEDRLPEALVASTPELAERLLHSTLGSVLALDPAERDVLLHTVRVWLDEDASAVDTATRLVCHRNTVLNRLRRLEDLTGRPLEATTTRVTLSLALMALDVLGLGQVESAA